jgi:hypothetical protein
MENKKDIWEGRIKKDLLIKFMKKAFPDEPVESSYYQEWVDRFKTGYPSRYMDENNLKLWVELLEEKEQYK